MRECGKTSLAFGTRPAVRGWPGSKTRMETRWASRSFEFRGSAMHGAVFASSPGLGCGESWAIITLKSECPGYSPAAHGASQPKQRPLHEDQRKAGLCGLDDGLHCEGRPRPHLAAEPLRSRIPG